jgi:hypothetical protein
MNQGILETLAGDLVRVATLLLKGYDLNDE